MRWIAIGLGGALGSLARQVVNDVVAALGLRVTPWATATVNLAGCFVVGVLAGLVAHDRLTLSATQRAFLFVGVLGGFTTFSSFGLDTLTLVRGGERALAIANVLAQVGLGLAAAFAGYGLSRP